MRITRLGPLGVRFAAAFVAVALAAVGVFAVAVLTADRGDVNRLAAAQRNRTVDVLATLATNARQESGRWAGADLRAVVSLAAAGGAAVDLVDAAGRPVLSVKAAPGRPAEPVVTVTRPLRIDGRPIGTLRATFSAGALSPAESQLRSSLASAVAWSAGFAVAGAVVVGVLVARGVVRPIRRLSAAAKALGGGERPAPVGPDAGPGELGELGRTFDAMAASLQREDELRRALVADVAHELRTPVAILQAGSEALLDGVVPASEAALSSLHEEIIRLGRMVEDLQTLASAEAAGLQLQRRPLDLARVAADAADSLSLRFRSKGITVHTELPPVPVLGDPDRLRQVVANLLGNAAKFTPAQGSVTMTVSREGAEAVLVVADSGPGVDEAERELIWDRFARGTAGRTAGGSGIGLAVVKELVAAHDGTVAVDRATEGGARFTVRLPCATDDGIR